jgi:alcohol dehydrogenase
MGCAVLTGGGAVLNVAKPQPGDSVAVVGLGGLGMAAVLTALAHEGVTVIGVDLSSERLERARALGAHQVFTPSDAAEQSITANYVIEAAGSARGFETAVSLTAPGGITIAVGLPNPKDLATVSPLRLVAEGRTIVGSYMGSSDPKRDIPVFLDLWRQGKLPIESLITSRITLAEMNEGMDHLADAHGIRQVMIP